MLPPGVVGLHAYDVVGDPGVHTGMPSTSLTLILSVDEPLQVGWAGRLATRTSHWGGLAGLHDLPAQIHHGGRQRGVQVSLSLAGARALLGLPASALAGVVADAADVDPVLRELPARLAEAAPERWESLVADALVAALASRAGAGAAVPRAEVGHAFRCLAAGMAVADVADEVGYSRRHLTALVRAEAGVSPKIYARLARFERSHALVKRGVRLAEVAARCGYADQSHLARDWRDLAGCSPRVWLSREFPFVLAAGGAGE